MTPPEASPRANGGSGRAEQAIASITDLVRSGEFAPGARLPTERQLMERFGMSRGSVREAVRALALVGVLEPRVGDGTYVTTLEPDLLLRGVGFASDLVRTESLLELHRVRRILEPEATRLAASRLGEPDLEQLEDRLRRLEDAETVAALIAADVAFHTVVFDACGNATLASLLRNLASGTLMARTWQLAVARRTVAAKLAAHRRIYEALVAGDAERAAAADLIHLGFAEEWLQQLRPA